MAGYDLVISKRARLLLFIGCIYKFIHSTEAAILQEVPTHVLQRQIKLSRHQPFCVVFKHSGIDSKLEKTVSALWKKPVRASNFTSWQCAAFDPDHSRLPPKTVRPDKLPCMRCYLGESSTYSYNGKVSKTRLKEWLTQLDSLYTEQSLEVTPEVLSQAQRQHRVVLLAFPDGPRHHEVEDMVYEVAAGIESCKALAVHLSSKEASHLRRRYSVNKYPSVVVIHNTVVHGINQTEEVHEDIRVFSNQEVTRHVLKVYLQARDIPVPHVTVVSFETMFDGVEQTQVLLCFYAHWAPDVHAYLTAFSMTVDTYTGSVPHLKFGLVDLILDSSKKFLVQVLRSGAMKNVPFLVLFQKVDGQLRHSVLHIGRPYPWVLAEHTGLLSIPKPWGSTRQQMSSLLEGPHGTMCLQSSSNLTDSEPYIPPVHKKPKVVRKRPIKVQPQKSWHDVFDTDHMETMLSRHDTIPLLTLETWPDLVEKSHAPRHIFYKAGRWAGEVTKVSLVIFIMADCGSCRRNHENFKEIQKAVAHLDGGSMYYVNCTDQAVLCAHHDVRGYPTIAAYRGLGWLNNTACISNSSSIKLHNYVRLDYHGVIKPEPVLEWFSNVASNAIEALKFNSPQRKQSDKNVKLIATLMPFSFMTGPQYSYRCMRLICELLYSVVDCVSKYTNLEDDNSIYDNRDVELVVMQIDLERRDGVSANLMQTGVSLHDTLEDQTNTHLHKFHSPHRYNIQKTQLCETDPVMCTEALIQFVLDHSRLPVTPVTSNRFHTAASHMREDDLPILIALAPSENLTNSAYFMKELTAAAYDLYNDVVVMTLDISKYTVWAAQFVPKLYGHQRAFEEATDDPDPLGMYVYPRLCIVEKHDHDHAALYPPVKRLVKRRRRKDFTREAITAFVHGYLQNPHAAIIETEHF